MVQNPNPEAVIQVEKITGSVLSNLECFSEKVLENKDSNLGHAVLETAALPTELHPYQ